MAKEASKQQLANLIQCYEQSLTAARELYDDKAIKQWAVENGVAINDSIKKTKEKLKEVFGIDYDSSGAKKQIIMEGSEVEVMADHMHGMKGGTAMVKRYSMPAMLSDITMTDGMMMKNHKWLINDEVKLK